MDSATIERVATADGAVALYLDLKPNELVDLEVAATAVIEWARSLKAAALALDSDFEYRVNLIAAEPGSSKWLAALERSRINQGAGRLKEGWEALPLVLRWTIALGVVIPLTAVPTYQYWLGDEKFSEAQLDQFEARLRKVADDPVVKSHKQSMFTKLPRDKNIVGVGAGIARSPDWKPDRTIPANQFAEADGLFALQEEVAEADRTLTPELDVILVAPHLHNPPKAWEFRQEGIPGTFKAAMKDERFLSAMDRSAVRETFRADIPMRIRLQIKQRLVGGEWKVIRRGRSVLEVISPTVE